MESRDSNTDNMLSKGKQRPLLPRSQLTPQHPSESIFPWNRSLFAQVCRCNHSPCTWAETTRWGPSKIEILRDPKRLLSYYWENRNEGVPSNPSRSDYKAKRDLGNRREIRINSLTRQEYEKDRNKPFWTKQEWEQGDTTQGSKVIMCLFSIQGNYKIK